jgi:hypothetical protein
MSPILFFISSQILKDHFQERLEKKEAEEKTHLSIKSGIFSYKDDESSEKNGDLTPTSLNFRNNVRSKLIGFGDKSRENEEIANQLSEKQKLDLEYSRIRYTVPYLVYQRVNLWKYIDKIALNFHLITAAVTIYLCVNW